MRNILGLVALVALGAVGYAVLSGTPHSKQVAVPVALVLDGHLVKADGSEFHFPAATPLGSIRHFAIYYSAAWCPPCQIFTPSLIDWYKKFKPAHPDFELVYVTEDTDRKSWLADMKEAAMPWPAYSFDDLQKDDKAINRFAGEGIPDLVLVDAGGRVEADSFTTLGIYRQPQAVIPDIEKLLGPGVAPTEPR